MNKKLVKHSMVATACFASVCAMNYKASAATIIGEEPVAGITVSLDKYYEMQQLQSEAKSVQNNAKSAPDTSSIETFQTKEEKVAAEDEKKEYENIGIANVDKYLNIRKEPNEKGKIIGKLPANGGCYIYSVDKDGWAKIKSGKVSGYVSTEYLITGDKVPALAKKVGTKVAVTKEVTVRVREKASLDEKVQTLTLVGQNESFEVEDDSNPDFVYVSLDDDKGYIHRSCVDVSYQLKKAIFYDTTDEDAVSAGNATVRQKLVAYAKQFLGNRYVFGGTSLTGGIDCSGFTMRIYQKFGYSITRTSRSQAHVGRTIRASQVKAGDLVFYAKAGRINHVAMYIGNGQIIHASNPRSGIKISNMYYKTPYKAVRIIND